MFNANRNIFYAPGTTQVFDFPCEVLKALSGYAGRSAFDSMCNAPDLFCITTLESLLHHRQFLWHLLAELRQHSLHKLDVPHTAVTQFFQVQLVGTSECPSRLADNEILVCVRRM